MTALIAGLLRRLLPHTESDTSFSYMTAPSLRVTAGKTSYCAFRVLPSWAPNLCSLQVCVILLFKYSNVWQGWSAILVEQLNKWSRARERHSLALAAEWAYPTH